MIQDIEIRHYHGFCGLAGGAKGFNRGHAKVGTMRAKMRCIGGFDVDPAACKDFLKLAGVPATCLDLFSRDQYIAFHRKQPPAGWRESTPDDIRRSAWYERPHIVFLSAPCKGFSGLLSEARSKDGKYQALNQLAERALWLMLEAWKDDPPELFIFENVPRIQNRGRALLDRLTALLHAYGYATAETTHDCGEIGGLAQSRKRFLMVARNLAKVPAFLYEPPKRPLRAVGEVLGRMPLPGDPAGGPMHSIPNLQWKTWVRLAFVEAGSDWRSLNKLRVKDGRLQDYLILPETWHESRAPRNFTDKKYKVTDFNEPANSVIGASTTGQGAFAVADPRIKRDRDEYLTAGEYGVVSWEEPSIAVQAQGNYDNGRWSVADPRCSFGNLPEATQKLVCVIRALDGTWHRPFTTLELAALQSLVDPEEMFAATPWDLHGNSDSAKRERIGNAVPPGAAEVISSVMAETLLLSWSGQRFKLSDTPVWVRAIAIALSVKTFDAEERR